MAQPRANAMTEAASTPMRAWSWRLGSVMAMSTMNREMVKPIPDSAAPPAIRRRVSPGASSPSPMRRISQVAPVMPTNLPITRPATMPHVNGERSAVDRLCASSRTPALTRANSGSTTNETVGPTVVCNRSLIEIESRSERLAARAYSEFGDCRKARIWSTARSTGRRSGVNTGMSSAITTPARVG